MTREEMAYEVYEYINRCAKELNKWINVVYTSHHFILVDEDDNPEYSNVFELRELVGDRVEDLPKEVWNYLQDHEVAITDENNHFVWE